VIDDLSLIAPVTAVRGNNDKGDWAKHLRSSELMQLGDIHIYVVHDIADMDIDPAAAGVRVVVSGHSHRPSIEDRDGVLYINPGSAGPRRFRLPVAAAELMVEGEKVSARIVHLLPQRT
jgi:putative phosphoesterase